MSEEQTTVEERYSRQASLIPPDKIATLTVCVIGVGAIGRQAALQLAASGVGRLKLIDHDDIERVNLGPQGYYESDIGKKKVEATADVARSNNPEISIEAVDRRYNPVDGDCDAVFMCVDSIETRRFIYESLMDRKPFLVDGRMAAETLRIVTAYDDSTYEDYEETLFSDDEAFEGECTARSTIYSANIAAGLMVAQFAKWVREMEMIIKPDFILNLLSGELFETE